MFFEAFAPQLPRSGKVIVDLQNHGSIDLAGLRERVGSARRYFGMLRHAPGDKVILFLDNSIDHIAILLALFDVDWIIVPLNPQLNRDKTSYLVRHSRAKCLVTSRAILKRSEWLKELRGSVILTDEIFRPAEASVAAPYPIQKYPARRKGLKFILYTSGTVGSPKGVMLSEESVRLKIMNLMHLLNFKPHAAFFSFLPFFSGHGMIPGMLVPLLSGCRMYIARFDPFLAFRFWEWVKRYRVRSFTSVPSILTLLKEQIGAFKKKDLKCLRTIFSASSKLPQAVYDWYADHLGIHVRNCYGLTETASWITVNRDAGKGEKAQCVGRPLGAALGVFDRKGKRLKHNEIGEIYVKSPYNMLGYFKNQRETKSCIAKGGFLKTGDMGYLDSGGRVFILDRIKRVIIKNGINVYPSEIDQVFLRHPDVKDSISFGVPEEHYGEEIITALIVRAGKRSKEKYQKYAMEALPVFLVPGGLFFPKEFPRGVTGKVKIEILRKQYLERR